MLACYIEANSCAKMALVRQCGELSLLGLSVQTVKVFLYSEPCPTRCTCVSTGAGCSMRGQCSPEPADHMPAADNDLSFAKPVDVALFIDPGGLKASCAEAQPALPAG